MASSGKSKAMLFMDFPIYPDFPSLKLFCQDSLCI